VSNVFRHLKSGRLVSINLVRQCPTGFTCAASSIANEFWEVGSITYYGVLKRYNGSTWVKEPLKVYTGSFVTKPTKRYNGSQWVLINTTGV
jgi:hypothetical protein